MRVYQYMRSIHGLSALKQRRLKISRIHELNDPFEFLGVDLSDRPFRRALTKTKAQISKKNGLLCFSASWRNPVLWAHYADNHRGICLGFDIPQELLRQVSYVNSRHPMPELLDEKFMQKLLFSKFSHWSYEDEYRVYTTLNDQIDGLYYKEFDESLVLKEVMVGEASSVTRASIRKALGSDKDKVNATKVRAAFRSFEIVEQKRKALWR